VDEPEVNVYGGIVAAPVFRNIARGALRRLGVVPEKPEPIPLPAVANAEVPRRGEAKKEIEVTQNEKSPEVPSFVGLSLREAVEKARTLNLRVKVQGHGYVVRQSPAAGSSRNRDQILVLNLQG
jgi:cell division protein FtsI (penicillin-binding protein 3)